MLGPNIGQNTTPSAYGYRAKIGVIVPPTNTVNEAEWNRMAPEGISIHAARMPLHADAASADGKKLLYDDVKKATLDLVQSTVGCHCLRMYGRLYGAAHHRALRIYV